MVLEQQKWPRTQRFNFNKKEKVSLVLEITRDAWANLKSEGCPIQVFSILVFCLRWVDEFSPFCFFLLSLAWLGLGNHELERWNRGTWKSLCAARGVIFCKGSIWMLIFVAFCYLCCLPSISVDASLAPKNLQSFTRKKREDETSHRREENSVGERKKTNKQCPFTRSRQITFGRHRCRDCQSCVATTTAPDPSPWNR